MTLSVVIVNYNTRDLLRDCLQSLKNSTISPEIIVVDNASSDGSTAMVANEFPDVKLLAQRENLWFCGGNNAGILAATGEYVLLLNPDTVVMPDALEKMVAFIEANPDYAGVTAQLHYPGGKIQRTCSRIPTFTYLLLEHTPLRIIFRARRQQLHDHHWYYDEGFDRDESRDVEVLPGSCLMMRREQLWLSEKLRLYFPEDDLAQRFAGEKFRFVAEARITHREKSSTQSWVATKIYFEDMLTYTREHHGTGQMVLLWLLTRPLYVAMWAKANAGARQTRP